MQEKALRAVKECISSTSEKENNLITEPESTVVENDDCAFSMPSGTMKKTIGKITYVANMHFKNEGQTFSEKLKRVLKADAGN